MTSITSTTPGVRRLAHGALLAALAPAAVRFSRALQDPAAAQRARLRAILDVTADTARGRALGLRRGMSIDELRRRAPIATYEELRPFVDRAAAGEPAVLAAQPLRAFERSGGSSAAQKLVPLTTGFLDEVERATAPWLLQAFARRPRLLGCQSYWSISPAASGAGATSGGIPIGLDDDSAYFSPLARRVVTQLQAVPPSVARLADMGAWRTATLHHLVAAEDLGLVSVWSPTFFTLLLQELERELDAFLAPLPRARRVAIETRLAAAGRFVAEAVWPRLALVSCWGDGPARDQLAALRARAPLVEIEEKGLLATEGVVSIPWPGADGGALAIDSHFLELIDVQTPAAPPLLAHELRVGATYSPVLTTSGGFVRYHLQDLVVCTGFVAGTPTVRFVGKLDRVSDLCGEKISAPQVDAALAAATRATGCAPRFALVAPTASADPGYALYVEVDDDESARRLAAHIEASLCAAHPYRYCRALGQLAPLRAVRVRDGAQGFVDALVARGARAGDVKPTHLDARPIWCASLTLEHP